MCEGETYNIHLYSLINNLYCIDLDLSDNLQVKLLLCSVYVGTYHEYNIQRLSYST